jgi:hypothetical protein
MFKIGRFVTHVNDEQMTPHDSRALIEVAGGKVVDTDQIYHHAEFPDEYNNYWTRDRTKATLKNGAQTPVVVQRFDPLMQEGPMEVEFFVSAQPRKRRGST